MNHAHNARQESTPDPGPPGALFMAEAALQLVLYGQWDVGGTLVLKLNGHEEIVDFPAGPWSTLAVLFLASVRAPHNWFKSVVSAYKLADALQSQGTFAFAAADDIYKHVFAIRSALAKAATRKLSADAELSGKQWAQRLVRNERGKGYRIALPAKNLKLVIDDSQYQVEEDAASPPGM